MEKRPRLADATFRETSREAPTDTVDAEAMAVRIVYGVHFLALAKCVYVGSTSRLEGVREAEHVDIRGGARRVAIAFSQRCWQPISDHFEFRELWRGTCTAKELKAIEQVFIEKHDSLVARRPTNGIVKDVDLMAGAYPQQLNVVRACTDQGLSYRINNCPKAMSAHRDTGTHQPPRPFIHPHDISAGTSHSCDHARTATPETR
jgi:hypothetical protein